MLVIVRPGRRNGGFIWGPLCRERVVGRLGGCLEKSEGTGACGEAGGGWMVGCRTGGNRPMKGNPGGSGNRCGYGGAGGVCGKKV